MEEWERVKLTVCDGHRAGGVKILREEVDVGLFVWSVVESVDVIAGCQKDGSRVRVSDEEGALRVSESSSTSAHTESGEPRQQVACEFLGNDGTIWLCLTF